MVLIGRIVGGCSSLALAIAPYTPQSPTVLIENTEKTCQFWPRPYNIVGSTQQMRSDDEVAIVDLENDLENDETMTNQILQANEANGGTRNGDSFICRWTDCGMAANHPYKRRSTLRHHLCEVRRKRIIDAADDAAGNESAETAAGTHPPI
ncbi:hypothetical protein F4818DRAFT_437781 [Hypoxylon cercidicola]|nr:hypothetical protein F4818DRAFT_437781 [Hypoxylon cercidicola]